MVMSVHMPSPSHHEHMMHMALYPIHADADAIMSRFIAHVAPIAIMSCSSIAYRTIQSVYSQYTVTVQLPTCRHDLQCHICTTRIATIANATYVMEQVCECAD